MEKLRILAESAKYDVSCSSSGTVRKGKQGMVGSTVGGVGICHSFADDGRCISLLKVMLTNYCLHQSSFKRHQTRHALCQRTRGDHDGVLSAQLYRRAVSQQRCRAQPRLHNGAPHSHCPRPATGSSLQRLYPSEKHSWLFAGTAQRGRALCRPHECEHRDTQGRVAEAVGAREGSQERVHTNEDDSAGSTGE